MVACWWMVACCEWMTFTPACWSTCCWFNHQQCAWKCKTLGEDNYCAGQNIGDDDNSNIDPSVLVCSTWMVKMVLPSLMMMRTIMIMIKILLTCIAGEIRRIVTFISSNGHIKHVCFTVQVSIDQTSRRGWVNMKYMIDIDLTKYKEMLVTV